MRIGRGCEPCRRRHIRCSTDTRASICDPCARANRPCRLGPPFRFQSVRHVYQKSNRAASNLHLDWGPDQVWVKTPHRVTFVQDSSPWSHGDPGLESQGVAHPSVASLGSRVDVRRVDTPPVEITDAPTTPSMTGEQRTQTTTAISPTTGNVPSPLPPPAPALTTREAFLLRAYTQKIAPWVSDPGLRSGPRAEAVGRHL